MALIAGLAMVAALALAAPAAALEQKVRVADGAAGDELGFSVAVDGDTLVLGAPGEDGSRGAVHVFRRTGDAWAQTAKLAASDGAVGDELGFAVAIDGDKVIAGAPADDVGANADQGSVYTFARAGAAARTETAKLTAGDGAAGDFFAASVAVDGDTIVAGAPFDDLGAKAQQGSAYTFARVGAAARNETAKLTAGDGAAGDELGSAVAVGGDTIVAGAPVDDVGANADQGSAYAFARTGAAARNETAKLTADDGAAADFLGVSVAIDGDRIVAGAPFDDLGANADQGSAYTFARTGAAARNEIAKLTAGDGAAGDQLGRSVAVDGDTIVAGAPADDGRRGSASVFFAATSPPPLPPPPAAPPQPPRPAPRPARPVLSSLRISPRTFRVGSSLPRIARSRTGTRISFSLSEPARVTLSFAKPQTGRRVGTTCRTATRSNRKRRRCTRYVTVGSFNVFARRGRNTASFSGRLTRTKRLGAGSYRLAATPTNAAHLTGHARTASLRIVTR